MIHNKTQHSTITQKTHIEQTALTTIILADDNKPFGNRLQQKENEITRILLQNPNRLDLGLDGLTLHEIINSSVKNDINILCLPEINTNRKNQRARIKYNDILNRQRKESLTYNSESTIPWSSPYTPGGTHTILHPTLQPRVTTHGDYPRLMGGWSWVTIRGRQNRKITIITVYKVYNRPIVTAGPLTAISQQWKIAQSKNRGNENIVDNTITDLQLFINSQQNNGTEIILNMDANETVNCKNSTIIKLCRIYKLCDTIALKHGTELEPNTYSRGLDRIVFILCSKALLPFISNVGILPFGMITFFDHRGLFIDINLHQFLFVF